MYRQRKELVQSLDLLAFTLFVYIWFVDGSTIWLFVKSALQVQFCNPIQMHPTWSLPFFAVFLSCFNFIVVLVHLLGGPIGAGKARTIILDFVGQDHQTGRLHMVLIDLVVAFVQLIMLIVAYEHGIDELRPDDEKSRLDEDEPDASEPSEACAGAQDAGPGQGWDADDEESSLFAPHREERPESSAASPGRWADESSSLSRPIAVIRLEPLVRTILDGNLAWPKGADEARDGGARGSAAPSGPRPNPDAVAASIAAAARAPAPAPLRTEGYPGHVARRSRSAAAPAAPSPQQRASTPSMANQDWPPAWLAIACNLVGTGSSSMERSPADRSGWASGWRRIRAWTNRPPAQAYQRVNTEE
ncbi:hypothetical protein ACQY0O_005146 [Thecaphora frezii]